MVLKKEKYIAPSFSIKNRLIRVLWNFVYIVFFITSPEFFNFWRIFLLRIFGAKIGKNVYVRSNVKIWAPWNLEIEDEVGIGDSVDLYSQDKIFLGYRSIVSQRSFLCTGTHDYTNPLHPLYTKPIIIKPHAWVAAEAFIGPGVTISEYSIVGARSVVLKDTNTYDIVAGNPAIFIKKRNFNL